MAKKNKNNGGFTLIEVLVVVLIIGVLTSVALPQYQNAVEKSRMQEGLQLAATFRDAQMVFYDTYNRYATLAEIEALDVSMPFSGNTEYWYGENRPTGTSFSVSLAGHSGSGRNYVASIQRIPIGQKYAILVLEDMKIGCEPKEKATTYERKLCEHIDATGSL